LAKTAETALRFLFSAMSPKTAEQSEADPFRGIPIAI
jgi:hypothetical protein